MENFTNSNYLILAGLDTISHNKSLYFIFYFFVYSAILFTNLLLVAVILLHERLHEPMYIFICNLCFNGLYGGTAIFPKLLTDIVAEIKTISDNGCLIQIFFIQTFGYNEIFFLTLMAYDRYMAICNPLRYSSIMTKVRVCKLVTFPWLYSFSISLIFIILIMKYSKCYNIIPYVYCESMSFLQLFCANVTVNSIFETCVAVSHFSILTIFVTYTYVQIFRACQNVSKGTKLKALNTCINHLLLLFVSFICGFLTFFQAQVGGSIPHFMEFLISMALFIFPPFLNPFIYGIRTQEIRSTIKKALQKQMIQSK
ncbi:olfactory receptor 52E4-like [Protopterus annectens]|uniref:olfactory receptor 52E4-like n=1 Tax=Protopterus annectens TaxID=7888 RepID=UPI001CFBAFC0|nr:olfactory receptor 52E4-like [Protopterus annectens]